MGCLQIGQGVRGIGPPNIRSVSLFAKKWSLMEREQGSQRQRWPHGCRITSTSETRQTLQVHFVLYSSRSFIGVLIDLERLLRMGVDIIASSREKALPQSGLGGSTTAGPLPGGGVTLTSPADLPPLKGWRPRAPSCEEVAALAAGGGRGGGGVGRADGRGGREGGAAAVGGGGLETWEARRAVLCQLRRARWKPGSTSFCLRAGSPQKACAALCMRTALLPVSLTSYPPSILTRTRRSSISVFLDRNSFTMSKLSDMVLL